MAAASGPETVVTHVIPALTAAYFILVSILKSRMAGIVRIAVVVANPVMDRPSNLRKLASILVFA